MIPEYGSPLPPSLPALFPYPGPGQVHLHLLSLACSPEQLANLQQILTGHELSRVNRLIDPERRARAIAGRGLLRVMLGRYLQEEPGSILLSEGEFGKPHLSEHLESDALGFNLSHAGDYLLLAVCAGYEVGVDLEQVREGIAYRAMVERYFSPPERRDLMSLPEEQQLQAFYRCWTRKEAYLKGAGSGFSQPADRFEVSLLPEQPARLLAHRNNPGEVERWSIRDVPVPGGFCAAVAVEIQAPQIMPFF